MGEGAFENLPGGFASLVTGQWRIAVREEFREAFATGAFSDPVRLMASGESCFRGRGRPARVTLPDGTSGVLRCYLHGGMFRGLTGSRFFRCTRPLRELRATERARRAGVSAPEVIAAFTRRRFVVFHEGFLLTREIEGARDLVAVLSAGEPVRTVFRELGRETRRMHEAGVWHADLHVKNVLLADGRVHIIDFDNAREKDEIPRHERIGNLLRFDRSVVKLEGKGVRVPLKDRLRFFSGYRTGSLDRRERAEVVRRCQRSLARHRRGWALFGTGS